MTTIDKIIDKNVKRMTGIGSLPHHSRDSALEFSLKLGIPFLPQIPLRNPSEFMIAQALEGLPGLQLEETTVVLNLEEWQNHTSLLDERLNKAFSMNPIHIYEGFEDFEPTASASSCWQPFLWELQEREIHLAKIQIAGPITCQWALKLKDGTSLNRYPEISTQVFRLVLARSLSMIKRMQLSGLQPILFLDEPGLYAFSPQNPRHFVCLQELKLMVQTLQKQGAWIGLHCCSDTHWPAVLSLGIDILAIDTHLFFARVLESENGKSLEKFVRSGGRLSLGVVPTSGSNALQSMTTQKLADSLLATLAQYWKAQPELIHQVLTEAIYTPACGLAFHSIFDAELILEKLMEVYESVTAS